MSFASSSEFLAMGGHGLYVWMSYGAALMLVVYHVISVRLRLRRFFRDALARETRERSRREAGLRQETGETQNR